MDCELFYAELSAQAPSYSRATLCCQPLAGAEETAAHELEKCIGLPGWEWELFQLGLQAQVGVCTKPGCLSRGR